MQWKDSYLTSLRDVKTVFEVYEWSVLKTEITWDVRRELETEDRHEGLGDTDGIENRYLSTCLGEGMYSKAEWVFSWGGTGEFGGKTEMGESCDSRVTVGDGVAGMLS